MEEKETGIKLSDSQLITAMQSAIESGQGLQDLMKLMTESLMRSERSLFLRDAGQKDNKANGYRPVQAGSLLGELSLSVPRDRLGVFQPVLLSVLNGQQQQLEDLCFELYGKGLTTRQIEDTIGKVYGSGYSRSQISRITGELSEEVAAWLGRRLSAHYSVIYMDAIQVKVRRERVTRRTMCCWACYPMANAKY